MKAAKVVPGLFIPPSVDCKALVMLGIWKMMVAIKHIDVVLEFYGLQFLKCLLLVTHLVCTTYYFCTFDV